MPDEDTAGNHDNGAEFMTREHCSLVHSNLEGKIDLVNQKLDYLTTLMTGGPEPDRGLLIRVDRLERLASILTWIAGSSALLAITALATVAWKVFIHVVKD